MDLDDYHRTQFPLAGIPVPELAAALAVVAAAVPGDREEARILRLDTRRDGYLFVETGRFTSPRAGSGRHVLLHRDPDGWVVVQVSSWRA